MNREAEQGYNSLRIAHCPECGYCLDGLSAVGRCPECGAGYDPSREVVIFGWGSGIKVRRYNTVDMGSLRWWVRGFFAAWVGVVTYEFIKPRGRVDWGMILAFVALYAFSCGYALYRRRRLVHLPAPVMARASRQGFGQRNGVGRLALNPWDGGDVVEVEAAGVGRYRLRIWRRRPTVVGGGDSVDIVIETDQNTAEGLRSRIESFQHQAIGPNAPVH